MRRTLPIVLMTIVLVGAFSATSSAAPSKIETDPFGSCYLDSGAVYCWSGSAQSTDDWVPFGAMFSGTPVLAAGLTAGVSDFDLGDYHGCAVVNGAAKCWGEAGPFALGNGTSSGSPVPVDVTGLGSGVSDISASAEQSCAVHQGAVKCWGAAEGLVLGFDSEISIEPFVVPGLGANASKVEVGDTFACAVVSAGVKCWGTGMLGDGVNHSEPALVNVNGLGSGVSAVIVDGATACAIQTGALKCWGSNDYSILGTGATGLTPVAIAGATSGVVDVDIAYGLICASNGAVYCWGAGTNGQFGNSTVSFSDTPQLVPGLTSGAVSVAVGGLSACAIVDSVAKCWGTNEFGVTGDGTVVDSGIPLELPAITSGASAIAAGEQLSCAVVSGSGKCWGNQKIPSSSNQPAGFSAANPTTVVGLESNTTGIDVSTPGCGIVSGAAKCWEGSGASPPATTITGGSSGVSSIAVDGYRGCAVVSGGARCGFVDEVSNPELVPVAGLSSGVTAVTQGAWHRCAVVNGAAKCWGVNEWGQLGDGTYEDSETPVSVQGLTSGVTAISAGRDFTCAVHNGAVKCWGNGYTGQLGDGERQESPTPVLADGLEDIATHITAGDSHACAIRSGAAMCWGSGFNGEVGNNSRLGWTKPESVVGFDSGVTAISAGMQHTCAIRNDAAYCWGLNTHGQLGVGTTLSLRPPTNVAAPANRPLVGIAYPAYDSLIRTNSPMLKIESSNATSVECRVDDNPWGPCPSVLTNLSEGDHFVRVSAESSSGEITLDETWFSVNSIAPTVNIISPANGTNVVSAQPPLVFTIPDSDVSYVECFLDGQELLDEYGDLGYCDFIPNLPALSVGSHSLRVVAHDIAGNSTTATSNFTFGVAPPTDARAVVSPSVKVAGKAKRSRGKLKLPLSFSFKVPPGIGSSTACSGTVKFVARGPKVKRVAASAKLHLSKNACVAKVVLRLPTKARGQKISIASTFAGNTAIAPVSKRTTVKIKK